MSKSPLRILHIASEMVPYIKTGGLADVVAALAAEFAGRGNDVRVVLPLYLAIDTTKYKLEKALAPMGVWMGDCQEWCVAWKLSAAAGVTVYFIEHGLFFKRFGLYHDENMNDYRDSARRFGFVSRAALQVCLDTQWSPDIVHCHDWQTALAGAYLKIWFANEPFFKNTASVLTIHNIAYQGCYPKHDYDYLGLGWQNFTPDVFESFDEINVLKGGIHFADRVTTVSPTYAKEVSSPFGGFGLAPAISRKGDRFTGILNGVDYAIWNPQTDPFLPAHFSPENLEGKKKCKAALQQEFGLEVDEHVAVIGVVGRFAQQKGFDVMAHALEGILPEMHMQFVVLGTGDSALEDYFYHLPERFPGKAGSFIGFSNEKAHLIEAGSDFFMMPSIFEPCGLNQMYSLKYGTLPIVRATGGLDDTVINYSEKDGSGTGFKFVDPKPHALYYTTGWAIATYYDRPHHIARMRQAAMACDFSWKKSADAYEKVYAQARQDVAERRVKIKASAKI